ncbi:hypothetical protein [Haliscomenobacter hydrossis]|uniref:Uncharacterized protein n=1 Tax=Haliscomenobacter hydrossis (strain ATCC 27775 / DSM 1100 / LMG 10767 / O) TaxID=760192 RepID=F4KQ91_HALH1|nr:hypothetical protein [Haliscomenobacter hydrossis]AEE48917.1 hypothetical protein Halhy_1018 [Haliscomenobacter hydrossis DSM 1100]
MHLTHSIPRKISLAWFFPILLMVIAGFWLAKSNNPDDDLSAEIQIVIDDGIEISIPLNGCTNFKLKDFKSARRWKKQFRDRGFDTNKIRDMLQNGRQESFVDWKGHHLLRIFDSDGNYIVVDPLTCEIWQVAPNTFLY